MDYSLPFFTDVWVVICCLIIATVLCHFIFVWYRLRPASFWKKIDYAWLSMAFLGLIGTVNANRVTYSDRMAELATHRSKFAFEWVQQVAKFGMNAGCREFVPSEFSPSPDVMEKTQREFDEQCQWFRKIAEALKNIDSTSIQQINILQLAGSQPKGGDQEAYTSFNESVVRYNTLIMELEILKDTEDSKGWTEGIQFLSPFLFAIALALRITKVSGEIKLTKSNQE